MNMLKRITQWSTLLGMAFVSTAHVASAAMVPYVESFSADAANWEDSVNNPLSYVATGGADGDGYASGAFNYNGYSSPFGGGPVVFRASASDGASGGAFVGDWLADGVGTISAFVRHDAPEALSFFMRVATPANFPGAVISSTISVLPNTWTEISWVVDPSNPFCFPEGGTCASALSSVGNFQIGTNAPVGLTDDDFAYTLDVDVVSILPIPEPGTALLMVLGLAGLATVRDEGRIG